MKNMSRKATNEYIGTKRRAYAQADCEPWLTFLAIAIGLTSRSDLLLSAVLASPADEASADCLGNGVDAVGDPELREDALEVLLHRVVGNRH